MKKPPTLEIPLHALTEAHIPDIFHRCDLSDLKLTNKQHGLLLQFIRPEEHKKKGLLISGQRETRKTTAAVVVLKSLVARHRYIVEWVDLRTLVDLRFQNSGNPFPEKTERYHRILDCDALCIDDCESHKNEGCFMVLDYVYRYRLHVGKPTIIVCEEDETSDPVLAKEFGTKFAEKVIHNSIHVSLDANEAD